MIATLRDLPSELVTEVLLYVPDNDLDQCYEVGHEVLSTKHFWIRRAHLYLNISPDQFDIRWSIEQYLPLQDLAGGGIHRSRYVELVCRCRRIIKGAEYFLQRQECLLRAIRQRDEELVKYFGKYQAVGFEEIVAAARSGYVSFFLAHHHKIPTLPEYEIGYSGREELISLVSTPGVKLLTGLIAGGHVGKAIDLFGPLCDLNSHFQGMAFRGAIGSGRLELVRTLIEMLNPPREDDNQTIVSYVVEGGSDQVLDYLFQEGYFRDIYSLGDINLERIAKRGHFNLLRHPLIKDTLTPERIGSETLFSTVLYGSYNLEAAQYLLDTSVWNYPTQALGLMRSYGSVLGSRAVEAQFNKDIRDPHFARYPIKLPTLPIKV